MIDAKMGARLLTRSQRRMVEIGAVTGNFSMRTVRSLQRMGVMHLVITSPNGQCGFMRLTPFGEAIQTVLKDRKRK